jgi:phospholipid/cholesterol/gamma-HCH transport system substrate-binding protein
VRRLLVRLIAFLGVFVLGLYFIGVDILNYHLGAQPFTVTALVPAASGLYQGATVDYRGVGVGQVTSLVLSPTGVTIKLGIDAGTRIPDNGLAEIKQLSALGEQYIDFQPSHAGGPYLQAGSVIPASRIVLPTPIGTALDNLSTLLNSVNGKDLQTFESWLTSAFIGTGPGLHQIITTGEELFNSLAAAQPETVNLVIDGNTDLHTLKATSGDFQSFAKSLASFTGQLDTSNGDLRDLINNASAAANTVGPFLASNNPAIEALIANFATDAQAANVYQPAVEALFQILPVVATRAAGALSGNEAHAEAAFNIGQSVCAYVPESLIHGPTQLTGLAELDNGCSTRNPDMLQRGAYNSPGG